MHAPFVLADRITRVGPEAAGAVVVSPVRARRVEFGFVAREEIPTGKTE